MSDSVEAYFSQLHDIRASGAGVAEISYYPALKSLLDEVGKHLKPKVTALMQLRNAGSGNPDGGLFTANQLKGWEPGADPLAGQLPNRGAIEVKGTADDAFAIAASEQVSRYVDGYGLVLVTNLRDFVLVGRDASGTGLRILESCRLAETEAGFWAKVAQPRKFAEEAGEGLTEFLRRVLLHNAPLADPKDVAWYLASYARTVRLRLEQKHELPALDALRGQLEDSLGLKFEGEKGDHFFRSTLVQTLFYGMFASWVLWARDRDHTVEIPWDRRFQWETATATLHVPMVYELFRQFADVRQLGALGISEVLEWTEEVLWRIDRRSFFEHFREDHAVQYFYEPFLEAFDPKLRKELGVWYTPDEVVKYMVARVDTVLREELGIADGLADPSVVVLDPCCGTGAYLVEVLRKIDETLQAKGADALTRQDVKRAAMSRVIGFEIMPAPFVVAHLQLGILLAELGVPLRDADERAAVYLTNALTGWGNGEVVPPKDNRVGPGQLHSTALFPEFAEERNAADRIKREEQILVVIGNPPYNGFAGTAVEEERGLSATYRKTNRVSKPIGQGLNDLYVRFYRLAERQVSERTQRGVVCLISNYSWLEGLSFTGMREHLLETFDLICIDNLNGDKYRTGKRTPDGLPDPSIFSTSHNREGIQVGTAIGMLVKCPGAGHRAKVEYRDVWGVDKLAQLAEDTLSPSTLRYSPVEPVLALGLSLAPSTVNREYVTWPPLIDVLPVFFPGVKTNRDDLVVDIDRDRLISRMSKYFDVLVPDSDIAAEVPSALSSINGFDGPAVRRRLQLRGFLPERVVPYLYRPFDRRWLYWEPEGNLLGRKSPEYVSQLRPGRRWLEARNKHILGTFDRGLVTAGLADNLGNGFSSFFPTLVSEDLLGVSQERPNLAPQVMDYTLALGVAPTAVWSHVAGVLNSTAYRRENADGLRSGWPRIPLPVDPAVLSASSEVGTAVADLLDPDACVDGVSSGTIRPDLRVMGSLSSAESKPLDPSFDLVVNARWGVAGQKSVTMPSTGKLTERPYTGDELTTIAEGAESRGVSMEQTIALIGDTCFDVYLNDVAYWRCVPSNVWRYTIGGYQVIKKWLSYRERTLLGRDLKPEEARYVTEMVRRIAALVLMRPELDANYERVKADVWEWPRVGPESRS